MESHARRFIAFVAIVLLWCCPTGRAQCTGHWITGDPLLNVSGPVLATLEFDLDGTGSKLVVAGEFAAAGDVIAHNIAAWDGERWSALGDGFDGNVTDLIVFRGELIAAGSFHVSGSESVSRIARWDGNAWRPLGAGLNSRVDALAVYKDELIAGGGFGGAGGMVARFIAKWDGTSWSTLGTGMNGGVGSMCVHGGDLFVCGIFTMAGDQPALRAARWDGSAWHPLGAGLPASTNSLVAWNGCIYAGGNFNMGGAQPDPVLCWDGASWTTISSELRPDGRSLIVYNGELVVSGTLRFEGSSEAGGVMAWNGKTWRHLGSNRPQQAVLCTFRGQLIAGSGTTATYDLRVLSDNDAWVSLGEPAWNGTVYSLAEFEGDLVAAGTFTLAGGVEAGGIARLSQDDWSPLGAVASPSSVARLCVHDGDLIHAAGYSVRAWHGTGWRELGTFEHTVRALSVHQGVLHVGASDGVYRLDGDSWSLLPRAPYSEMYVQHLASVNDRLFAAGTIRRNSGSVENLVEWNGAEWRSVGGGVAGEINALLAHGDELLIGGMYNLRIGATTGALLAWNGAASHQVLAGHEVRLLSHYRGEVVAAGSLEIPGDAHIARLNGTTWEAIPSAIPSNTFGVLYCMQGMEDVLAVGGTIQVIEGVLSNRVARWRYETGDFDGDGFATGSDFDAYIVAFEAGDTSADTDDDGFLTGTDFDRFVLAFEAGC